VYGDAAGWTVDAETSLLVGPNLEMLGGEDVQQHLLADRLARVLTDDLAFEQVRWLQCLLERFRLALRRGPDEQPLPREALIGYAERDAHVLAHAADGEAPSASVVMIAGQASRPWGDLRTRTPGRRLSEPPTDVLEPEPPPPRPIPPSPPVELELAGGRPHFRDVQFDRVGRQS
jgi:hypothetical protein